MCVMLVLVCISPCRCALSAGVSGVAWSDYHAVGAVLMSHGVAWRGLVSSSRMEPPVSLLLSSRWVVSACFPFKHE